MARPAPRWHTLSPELLELIFSHVPPLDNARLFCPPLAVCRSWRIDLRARLRLLVLLCGRSTALVRASTNGILDVVQELLRPLNTQEGWAPELDEAVVQAARNGHQEVVRELMTLRADRLSPACPECRMVESEVLASAAASGNVALVRMLLEWPGRLIRADSSELEIEEEYYGWPCIVDGALQRACANGHEPVVRLLLEWPNSPPRLERVDGGFCLLDSVIRTGREDVALTLLEWYPCFNPDFYRAMPAVESAGRMGMQRLVRRMLERAERPVTVFTMEAMLISSASSGNAELVRMLLDWPTSAPHPGCRAGAALWAAGRGGHLTVFNLLAGRCFPWRG